MDWVQSSERGTTRRQSSRSGRCVARELDCLEPLWRDQ